MVGDDVKIEDVKISFFYILVTRTPHTPAHARPPTPAGPNAFPKLIRTKARRVKQDWIDGPISTKIVPIELSIQNM